MPRPKHAPVAWLILALGAAAAEAPTVAARPAAGGTLGATPAANAAEAEGTVPLYPGAAPYTPPQTAQAKLFESLVPPGTSIKAYLTRDPFDKVMAFYRGIGKEYRPPNLKPERLPDGKPIQKAFVIFDGAPDLSASRSSARIQHPFIGLTTRHGMTREYDDVRDVTEIVVTVKGVPRQVPRPGKAPNPSQTQSL